MDMREASSSSSLAPLLSFWNCLLGLSSSSSSKCSDSRSRRANLGVIDALEVNDGETPTPLSPGLLMLLPLPPGGG